jgi:hypothetical protein
MIPVSSPESNCSSMGAQRKSRDMEFGVPCAFRARTFRGRLLTTWKCLHRRRVALLLRTATSMSRWHSGVIEHRTGWSTPSGLPLSRPLAGQLTMPIQPNARLIRPSVPAGTLIARSFLSYLIGLRGSNSAGMGVEPISIPADDLHARTTTQPVGAICQAIGQHIDPVTRLKVHDGCAEAPSLRHAHSSISTA